MAHGLAVCAQGSATSTALRPDCCSNSDTACAYRRIKALAASAARWISSDPLWFRASKFSAQGGGQGQMQWPCPCGRLAALMSAMTASTPSSEVPDISPMKQATERVPIRSGRGAPASDSATSSLACTLAHHLAKRGLDAASSGTVSDDLGHEQRILVLAR
jgi:hypothetical protein